MDDRRRQASIEAMQQQIDDLGRGRRAFGPERLRRLESLLAAHAGEIRAARAGGLDQRVAADRWAAAVAARLAGSVCPALLSRFAALLPITDGTGQGPEAGEATAAQYAEAIAAMFAWERAAGPDSRLRAAVQGRLAAITRTCRARIAAHLDLPGDGDFPDVRLLARDILRVEAVEWAVEIAGGPMAAAELRLLAHHAARQAVQWAGRVFDRFKASPDEYSHFDAVATVSAVDDLLVVIQRVMDSDREDRRAGSHPFVLTLGEQALQDFVEGLQRMTARYLDIAEAHLMSTGPGGAFVMSVLQLLQRILRLGRALSHSVELIEVRVNHEVALTRLLGLRDRLRTATARRDAPPELAARLGVIMTALAETGTPIGASPAGKSG